ncbi:MAG: BrnA antitoxin family protein [Pseudomonadota bacterium]
MTKKEHDPLDPFPTMTRRERLEYRFFCDQMNQFEWHMRWAIWDQKIVPMEWHTALERENQPSKTRVTLRLDEDLVKFFRKLGPGWQTTLNSVVRAFVKARLSGIIQGPLSLEKTLPGLGDYPEIGDTEEKLEQMAEHLRGGGQDPIARMMQELLRRKAKDLG